MGYKTGPRVEFLTLPAGFTGGLHLDLHLSVIHRPLLPAVISRHRKLVELLATVLQLLRVLNVPWGGGGGWRGSGALEKVWGGLVSQ